MDEQPKEPPKAKMHRGEVRLRLVEAAVAAGRRQPAEIIAFCRFLEAYVVNVPYSQLVSSAIDHNVADLARDAALTLEREDPRPQQSLGRGGGGTEKHSEPVAPEKDDAPLSVDKEVQKVMDYFKREESPPVEESEEPSPPEDEVGSRERPTTDYKQGEFLRAGKFDELIKQVWHERCPTQAIADYLQVSKLALENRVNVLRLSPRRSMPRGIPGARAYSEWAYRLSKDPDIRRPKE